MPVAWIMKTSQWRWAVENRCVFRARLNLKALSDRCGDRSAGGRRLPVAGPLTAKLRCPVEIRERGTSRVPVAADRNLRIIVNEYAVCLERVESSKSSGTQHRYSDNWGTAGGKKMEFSGGSSPPATPLPPPMAQSTLT